MIVNLSQLNANRISHSIEFYSLFLVVFSSCINSIIISFYSGNAKFAIVSVAGSAWLILQIVCNAFVTLYCVWCVYVLWKYIERLFSLTLLTCNAPINMFDLYVPSIARYQKRFVYGQYKQYSILVNRMAIVNSQLAWIGFLEREKR